MKTIYKYELKGPLPFQHRITEILVPSGFQPIKFSWQAGVPVMHALVDTENKSVTEKFALCATGLDLEAFLHVVGGQTWQYLDTIFVDYYVWHVFQLKPVFTYGSEG